MRLENVIQTATVGNNKTGKIIRDSKKNKNNYNVILM